jgi:phage tail sheath protein FI
MAKLYSTPGVYIEEKNAFTNSVVPVATAIPCFIGFTEKATRDHQSLSEKLFRISSFDEYNRYFGGPPLITYNVTLDPAAKDPIKVTPDAATQFYLYYSLKLYFNNGGRDCYIYSAGNYLKEKVYEQNGCWDGGKCFEITAQRTGTNYDCNPRTDIRLKNLKIITHFSSWLYLM